MSIKTHRQSRLRAILGRRHPHNQEELAAMLRREGIEATQATLSRDLRELGALKGPGGYTLADSGPKEGGDRELREAAAAFLLSAQAAGNLVVLRTGPGQAPAMALALDRTTLEGLVGTVAGDDTVFIAAATPRQGAKIAWLLGDMAARP